MVAPIDFTKRQTQQARQIADDVSLDLNSMAFSKMDKKFDEALEALEEIMKDKSNQAKDRIAAAKFILEQRSALANDIQKMVLANKLATARMLQLSSMKNVTPADEEENMVAIPIFDPHNIDYDA